MLSNRPPGRRLAVSGRVRIAPMRPLRASWALALLGGLAVASHIDKEAFSIISQLGFITEDMGFDALEMSPNMEVSSRQMAGKPTMIMLRLDARTCLLLAMVSSGPCL